MSAIKKFSEDLQRYVAKAQAIEADDPHRSIPQYLKVAEFILEFIKQPGLSPSFRFTMKQQVNNIIQKVEEIQATPNLSPKVREEIQQGIADGTFTVKEIDEFDIFNLPDVPTDDDITIPESAPASKQSAPASQPAPSGAPSVSRTPPNASLSLDDMDELAKKIDFLKEIQPGQFSGPITPFDQDSVSARIKEDTGSIKIDDSQGITKVEGGLGADAGKTEGSGLKIGPNISFARDKISESMSGAKKDPLASPSDPYSNLNPKEKLCFACGTPLQSNEAVCPNCGAENISQ
jgi:sulfur relay (sulfurtransferase) DsrC/TusE family protein